MKHVIGARCVACGKETQAREGTLTCPSCQGILDIQYDYAGLRQSLNPRTLADRKDPSMWRYLEWLPVPQDRIPEGLRIGGSPLYQAPRLAKILGLKTLYIKDDGLNPTASLKDRASALAVFRAEAAGASTIACASTGNAASSLAGNSAARGLKSYIFVPARAPMGKIAQLLIFGANVIKVKGSYEETFRLSAEAIERWGWYNRNAAINPYLSEGKKTVSYEIVEQLNWKVPDYVAVSVGDGCTIAGVWKGFKDLFHMGFIDRLPKLISVQAKGCNPINYGVDQQCALLPMEENTCADSIAVGVPRNYDKAVQAIIESKGLTLNVSDEEILAAMGLLGRTCGVFGEPAGVTATAGIKKALEQGLLPEDASVVSLVTGNGLKDIKNAIEASGQCPEIEPSMGQLLEAFKKIQGPA